MKRAWSFSTTVRNPDRLRGFLEVLSKLEGEKFDSANQEKFQILLIQNKLYEPSDLTDQEQKYFFSEEPITFELAKKIFQKQNYADPPMRGRMSAAALSKLGLCIAKGSRDKIKITPRGKQLLDPTIKLDEFFLNYFLKWQMPYPETTTYTERNGFYIKPFIGTLHLIKKVNQIWKDLGNDSVGVSKEEFSLFVPTLINYSDINSQAEKLIEFRKKCKEKPSEKSKYKKEFAQWFFETTDNGKIEKHLQALKDYGDNIVRYFRITGYIRIRGGGYYLDIESRRELEINSILDSDIVNLLVFDNLDSYLEYLGDNTKPVLPWEEIPKLKEIYLYLASQINEKNTELEELDVKITKISFKTKGELEDISKEELILENQKLRTKLLELEKDKQRKDMTDPEEICKCIDDLTNIYQSQKKFSIELERLTALALVAINDALNVKPNYPVGDDGQPTFTAPQGVPDIECYYEGFNLISEVTMLKSRDQWYNEGQPVMRHLRDFEDKNSDKTTYCLFIAPTLHQDTISTFWASIKHGYRGIQQKIIPLTIAQFVKILKIMKVDMISTGNRLPHTSFLGLYDKIIDSSENLDSEDDWMKGIPNKIDEWEKEITS